MGYEIEFAEPVRDYLTATAQLTDGDREAVVAGVIDELSRDADYFYGKYPLGHESLLFRYDYAHPTERTLFTFDFIVDASSREMGVMRVVYAECTAEPMR